MDIMQRQKILLKQAIEHRWIVFELKKRKKIDDTVIQIGQAKFGSIAARVAFLRRKGILDYNIIDMVNMSRNELRRSKAW